MGISKAEKIRRDELFQKGFKVCCACNEILPIDNFCKNSSGAYGFNNACKECKRVIDKKYYQNNKEKCNIAHKRYCEEHKDAIQSYKRNYYIEHKDEIAQYNKNYREEHNCELAVYFHEYYLDNMERIKTRVKEWDKTESGKLSRKNANHRRKALMKDIEGDYSKSQLKQVLEFFDYKCAYTGELLEDNYHIDHIIPVSKGGTNYIWNIVPSNQNPNISKRDNVMEEWFRKQPYFSEERLQKIYEWIELHQSIQGEEDNETRYFEEIA